MGFFGKAKRIVWDEEEQEPPEVPETKNEIIEVEVNESPESKSTSSKNHTKPKPTATVERGRNEARKIKREYDTNRKITTVTERLNRLAVNDRMDMMAQIASAVIEGTISCCLIGGSPGLGKTHCVVEDLLKGKYKRVEHEDYLIIKAGVSAFGVYKLVVEWAEKAHQAKAEAKSNKSKGLKVTAKIPVIVFDDVPLWSDRRMVDLLKALMDTSDRRIVSWLTDRSETDPEKAKQLGKLPAQVEYTGGVIVITNEDEKKMNPAVLDRTMYLPIEVNAEEMKHRMRTICPLLEKGMDPKLRQQVLEWILSDKYEGKERSMRTLVKALKLAASAPKGTDRNGRPHWEKTVSIVN